MNCERLNLKPPSKLLQLFERLRLLREIGPEHLCPDKETLDELLKRYPDLAGDRGAIGLGDEGRCQSYCDCPGWWKKLLELEKML